MDKGVLFIWGMLAQVSLSLWITEYFEENLVNTVLFVTVGYNIFASVIIFNLDLVTDWEIEASTKKEALKIALFGFFSYITPIILLVKLYKDFDKLE